MRIELGSFCCPVRHFAAAVVSGAVQKLLLAAAVTDALLPSSRQLASDLKISRNTINQVLQQLVAEGYLLGQQGRGYQVISTAP